jgi:hypothetical protein
MVFSKEIDFIIQLLLSCVPGPAIKMPEKSGED